MPKNQRYHQRIEMKFFMSHYSYKSMAGAKFESSSFSSFGDMMSQNFPLKKGASHGIRIFTPGKCVNLSNSVHFRPRIDPHVNFTNFEAEEAVFIFKILETSQ